MKRSKENGDFAESIFLVHVGLVRRAGLVGLFIVALFVPAAFSADAPEGIAAKYRYDAGIEKDADVIFADNFDSWGGDGTQKPDKWHGIRQRKTSRTRAVPGKIDDKAPDGRVLEIACWSAEGESQVGGLSLKLGNYNHANENLGPGYDEVFVRYYMKLGDNYRGVRNHGANLGGRDLAMKDPAWVGVAGVRDVASRGYFYSGLQPYGEQGSHELEMGFYSYHMDKPGPWGDRYDVQKHIPIEIGRWYCLERHMRLNSVDASSGEAAKDGIEELWVDGVLSIRREGLRFRRSPTLRIASFSLETYYHGLPADFTESKPIEVYFDDVVIAKKYIGPTGGR